MNLSEMTIHHYKNLNGSPAVPLAVAVLDELITVERSAYYRESLLFSWDHEVLHGVMLGQGPDGKGTTECGILTFKDAKWDNTLYVTMGFVLPLHRRGGVYAALWKKLVAIATERERRWIVGGTHPTNAPMIETMKALGRVESRIIFEYQVPAKNVLYQEALKDDMEESK